jgi:hypothetical protein
MGLFGKSVTDEEWLAQVKPLYQAVLPLARALEGAVANESIDDEVSAVQDALHKLPTIAESIRALRAPTSSEARRAKKHLDSAAKGYADAVKQGAKFLKDLAGGPGERMHWGGVSTRAAAGRLAFEQTMFQELVKGARKPMEEASAFFGNI